ncbi:MAG TPA: phosphatidate cytidylyltransferase [Candidatus Kapabacteria bacterium]|nr:phosphatidate cytidylyltransferase [Candidatus Kapabacteria bacterium]
MSNLAQRVLVAVIAIPIVLFIVLYKPLGFYALAVMLSGMTVWEYYGLARTKGIAPQNILGVVLTMITALIFGHYRLKYLFGWDTDIVIGIAMAALFLGAFIILAVELFRNLPNPIEQTAITLFGAVYIGIGCGSLFGIFDSLAFWITSKEMYSHYMPGLFILTVLVSIWVCDSAAYFAGRAFGKHKFFERVSPKKTWEGAIAGFIASIALWAVAPMVIEPLAFLGTTNCIIIGIIAGSIGQIGDLGKSLLKRDAGVKDSSNLIPGHGGVLDRLDSIIFVSPVLFILLNALHYLRLLGV